MNPKIRKGIEDAIISWEKRANGEEVAEACPVCVSIESDCNLCPIGNSCRNTPLMDYLTRGHQHEDAVRAVEFLKGLLKEN